jgi:hypothetical protein
MTTISKTIRNKTANLQTAQPTWKRLCELGGAAALLTVLTGLSEILITFLPGGFTSAETVGEWFALLQNNTFLGLRNLGLLNIIMVAFGIPLTYALYIVHREKNKTLADLALIVSLLGTAVFYATNRAFPILDLSIRHAVASTEAQKMMLEAAGQAMLSVGQSHTPGTFLAFFFSEIGGMLIAVLALRGKTFGRFTGLAGIVGFGFLFVYEILASFLPSAHDVSLVFAMVGGLSNIAWYILVSRRFFQLRHSAGSLR